MSENLGSDTLSSTPLLLLKWWMRIVGVFYLLLFVAAAVIRLPIQILGPEGTLALNASEMNLPCSLWILGSFSGLHWPLWVSGSLLDPVIRFGQEH